MEVLFIKTHNCLIKFRFVDRFIHQMLKKKKSENNCSA